MFATNCLYIINAILSYRNKLFMHIESNLVYKTGVQESWHKI